MPTVDKLVQGAKGLKVKEIPGYVGKFASENWTPAKTSNRLINWFHEYKVKVCFLRVSVLSCIVNVLGRFSCDRYDIVLLKSILRHSFACVWLKP